MKVQCDECKKEFVLNDEAQKAKFVRCPYCYARRDNNATKKKI